MSYQASIPISHQGLLDRINNTNPRETARVATQVLNRIQDESPDLQLTGAAVVFLSLVRRFNIHAPDLLIAIDNMVKDARRYDDASFKGIQDYFDNEI